MPFHSGQAKLNFINSSRAKIDFLYSNLLHSIRAKTNFLNSSRAKIDFLHYNLFQSDNNRFCPVQAISGRQKPTFPIPSSFSQATPDFFHSKPFQSGQYC
jgi:hypothetical protein